MPDLEAIARLLDERRRGHSLPQALYNSQDAFDFDMAAIFGRSRTIAGVASGRVLATARSRLAIRVCCCSGSMRAFNTV